MRRAFILFSGGIDSSTILGLYLNDPQINEIHCVNFRYGSTHGEHEQKAAKDVLQFYRAHHPSKKVIYHRFNIQQPMRSFSSALLSSSDIEMPEGAYSPHNNQTIVPGRNLIFASIIAGLAESKGGGRIVLGVHDTDHAAFPDCRVEFIEALAETIKLSSAGKVCVEAPLVKHPKEEVLLIGHSLTPAVPYRLTRSCYKDQPDSCGVCPTCTSRLSAFSAIGKVDPINYEKR